MLFLPTVPQKHWPACCRVPPSPVLVLPPQDTRIWWLIPGIWAGKGRGAVCSLGLRGFLPAKDKLFVQKEQEPLALIYIWCQCGLYQHSTNFHSNPISLPVAAGRDRRDMTHPETETDQGQEGRSAALLRTLPCQHTPLPSARNPTAPPSDQQVLILLRENGTSCTSAAQPDGPCCKSIAATPPVPTTCSAPPL